MELNQKEVDFYQYCNTCNHKDLKEEQEPCSDCLDNPMATNSAKPIHYEEGNRNHASKK